MAAIASFGVDAARLHWDFTSVAFAGAYAEQDPVAPHIGFGHRRPGVRIIPTPRALPRKPRHRNNQDQKDCSG